MQRFFLYGTFKVYHADDQQFTHTDAALFDGYVCVEAGLRGPNGDLLGHELIRPVWPQGVAQEASEILALDQQ